MNACVPILSSIYASPLPGVALPLSGSVPSVTESGLDGGGRVGGWVLGRVGSLGTMRTTVLDLSVGREMHEAINRCQPPC